MIIDAYSQDHVMRGSSAQVGYSLAMTARLLVEDIADLRVGGGLPAYVRTVVSALTPQRMLLVEVFGLSLEQDPARTIARSVITAIFELASAYNIVSLSDDVETLFHQRILIIDPDGKPYVGLVGAAMGMVESLRD